MRGSRTISLFALIIIVTTLLASGCGAKIFIEIETIPEGQAEIRILHGPRLGLITSTTANIYWDTDVPGIGTIVWETEEYAFTMSEETATTRHRLTLTDLTPGTTYHYRVKTGTATSPEHAFSTAPLDDEEFTFASMADNRGHSEQADLAGLTEAFQKILAQVASLHPDFVLHAGDIFYGSSQLANLKKLYDNFKSATDELAAETPILISPGNHEMQPIGPAPGSPTAMDPLDVFNEELFQSKGFLEGYPGTCYSWDWGNSHFVSIDTCRFNPAMKYNGAYYLSDGEIAWLESDLQQARDRGARHIFVFGHAEAFLPDWLSKEMANPYLGSYPEQRDKFWAVLVNHRVDAYICGHLHVFDVEEVSGVVQWLNGNSGVVEDPQEQGLNGFTLWRVRGDTVTAEYINDRGETKYTRTL
jgi:3',5'-cyclic AMP phosphodiesterase CpdA